MARPLRPASVPHRPASRRPDVERSTWQRSQASQERFEAPAAAPVVLSPSGLPSRGRPVHFTRIEGAAADVMLPASGRGGAESFLDYATALHRFDAFADQRKAVASLVQVPRADAPAPPSDRPRVGVLIHEAAHLTERRVDIDNLLSVVRRIGATPVLIPPMADLAVGADPRVRADAINGLLGQLHGVVGPGGRDIHPRIYRSPNRGSVETNYARDRFQVDFLAQGLDRELFFFCICRLHQLINVAAGATLVQDLMSEGLVSRTHAQYELGLEQDDVISFDATDGLLEHRVQLRGELSELLGSTELVTNSFHHQVVEEAAPGFEVAATIRDPLTGHELIEATTRWNALSLQFHPEFRTQEAASQQLLETLKRAWVFHAVQALRAEGRLLTPEAIEAAVKARGVELTQVDVKWIREVLTPRLAP